MIRVSLMNLMESFPGSYINARGEFIAHIKANEYFNVYDCKTHEEVKCKVLEWLSRGACKTAPFKTDRQNREFNHFMLDGINTFLGTNFSAEEMLEIYIKLGNQIDRGLTLMFIRSGYHMALLK